MDFRSKIPSYVGMTDFSQSLPAETRLFMFSR